MQRSRLLPLLAVVLLASSLAWADDAEVDEKDVVVLTSENFAETVKKSKFVLVEFYAPWCGHCKKLKPEYAAAATELKAFDPSIVISKVDATEQSELGKEHEITGYPTLKWFVDGAATEYNGGRTAGDIVRWVKKRAGPSTTDLGSVAELDAARPKDGVCLVAVLDKLSGDDFDAYAKIAAASDDVEYHTTTSDAVAKALGLGDAARPAYALLRAYEGFDPETVTSVDHAAFKDGALAEKVKAFLRAERLPAYLPFSSKTSSAIFGSGVDRQIIVAAPADQLAPGAPLEAALRAASPRNRGRVVTVIAALGDESAKAVVDFFGLSAVSQEPQVVGFHATENGKFLYPGSPSVTADALVAFADAMEAGTAERLLKSADAPDQATVEGLTTVVGSTFESLVLDTTKDVLLEVYAPWCGHCKKIKPVYDKLAKRFEGVDSVVIAAMDGTTNEHPTIQVRGYPSFFWFAANDKTPVAYDGGRTVAGFVKYIKENAYTKFTLPKKKKKAKKAAKAEEEKEDDEEHDEL